MWRFSTEASMKMTKLGIMRGGLAAVAMAAACAGFAQAQTFPAKSIRMIFPFPPGGPTDLLGRAIAQKMSDQMGQQVVADNRPGAGGNLGLRFLFKKYFEFI